MPSDPSVSRNENIDQPQSPNELLQPQAELPLATEPLSDSPPEITAAVDQPAPACCRVCEAYISVSSRFCHQCGTDQKPRLAALEIKQRERKHQQEWTLVRNLIWFYVIYLSTLLPLAWIPDKYIANAELIIGWVDALLILGYWWQSGELLRSSLRPQRSLLTPILLSVSSLLILMPINIGYHALLQFVFAIKPDELPEVTEPFTLAGYGIAVQFYAIALMPAIWEELAFRGLIQGRLLTIVGRKEAIGLTAALFAIIHGQWLSLPYLFLLGLVLGTLRSRYHSLLPGMILHALHNAIVILL